VEGAMKSGELGKTDACDTLRQRVSAYGLAAVPAVHTPLSNAAVHTPLAARP